MGCLNDIICGARTIIGIRDYDLCKKPESNLLINDIPGITIKNAASIATEELKSGYGVLNEVINRGIRLVFQDFSNQVGQAFDFNAIVQTRKLLQFDASSLPAVAKNRGLVIKRWRSEVSQIYIEQIYIKAKRSGVATVKIIDGSIIKSYEVDLIADQLFTLRTDYVAFGEQVSITMDDTNFGVYSGNINPRNSSGSCGSCGWQDDGLFITGWDGTSEQNKYFGIGVNASIRCYEENIICSLLPRMYFLFWYAAAREYFEEQISSNRLNPVTIFTKDQAKENLAKYSEKYDKSFAEFVPTIKKYLLTTKGDCFVCNGSKYAQTHP